MSKKSRGSPVRMPRFQVDLKILPLSSVPNILLKKKQGKKAGRGNSPPGIYPK
jgi:hypothetical protein